MLEKITMQKEKNLTVKEGFELFLRKCRVKNLTEVSIRSYEQKLKLFFVYLGEDSLLHCISSDVVENYVLWLRENYRCGDITINSYLRSVRAFLYYCMDCDYIKRFKVEMIKAEKPLKETYSTEELEKLLKKPDVHNCKFSEFKARAFANYLIGTGNRISSAVNLKIKDISFEDGVIYLRHTKNRKQQIIPLSKTLADVLTEYLEFRGGTEDDYVFCDSWGNKSKAVTYTRLMYDYNISRNVNKTGCHLFRHTFAKNWILAGGDVFRLQKILGHSDISVTKEYVQMFGADLQMDFERYNPLDRLYLKTHREKIKM